MSVVAWVDVDHRHSDEMDRLLDAFREPSTLDEIGIGTVRDALSDLLFPGTSTLHSRARYLLFTAWGVTSVAERRLPLDRALEELRRHELALVFRGDDLGVIGHRAGRPGPVGRPRRPRRPRQEAEEKQPAEGGPRAGRPRGTHSPSRASSSRSSFWRLLKRVGTCTPRVT